MAPINQELIIQRIDQLLATKVEDPGAVGYGAVNEALHGALNVLIAVHGSGSQQQANLLQAVDAAYTNKTSGLEYLFVRHVWPAVCGALRALKADLQAGLVGNIQRRTIGEVVSDMLGLAKEALAEGTEGSKKVAAVLAAAAYEDTIRRMGESFANVQGRPQLQEIVTALKNTNAIQGSEVGIVQSLLSFRNNALHAHWDKVTDTATSTCINLVEALLLKHFS